MNINFETLEAGNAKNTSIQQTNADRATTSQSTSFPAGNVEKGGYAIDISGTVMDNNAYEGHGRTTREIMQDAGQQDIAVWHNYMAVMSNTMSTEDFAKLQEDGFPPESTDVGTAVTIVDHIKAALIKGGVQVAGYTDTVKEETLEKITGNQVLAQEMTRQFARQDIPATEENVKAVADTCKRAEELTELSDGAKKYLIQNQMEPTIDHLYLAQYTARDDGSKQTKGYYTDELPGYYARKAETPDFDKLQPQLEQVINDSGLEITEETLSESKWLVEKGIPLTTDALISLHELNQIKLPPDTEQTICSAVLAIASGKQAWMGNLADDKSIYEKAVAYKELVQNISEEAVDQITEEGKTLNLKNLEAAQKQVGQGELSSRLLLEETRLQMTIEANLHLLRKGFSIDYAPLQELVEQLRTANRQYQQQLTGNQDPVEAAKQSAQYRTAVSKLQEIPSFPVALVGKIVEEGGKLDSLDNVYKAGQNLKQVYEKAGQTYEALMTEPRRDLGDSIQKAFRNVDTILEDMELPVSEENRRAVRILGYNQMEVTNENLNQIKEMDQLLTGVIGKCKPGAVLQMIREGMNPMNLSLEEVDSYLEQQFATGDSDEGYSSFLYELEQKNEITAEERSSYIGIYRLIRQMEKSENAAIGMVAQTGAEYSFRNLLSAHRSSKKQGMDIRLDTESAGISLKEQTDSISAQIEKAYAVQTESIEAIRKLQDTPDKIIEILLSNHQVITADTVAAATGMLEQPGALYKGVAEISKKKESPTARAKQQADTEEADLPAAEGMVLQDAMDTLLARMTDRENTRQAFADLQSSLEDILADAIGESRIGELDIKALSQTYKQLQLAGHYADEERFEVPVNIDGELTAVSLKVIHNSPKMGRVSCYTQSESIGRVGAEFRIQEGRLSGYIVCDQEKGIDKLKQTQEQLTGQLQKLTLQTENLNFIYGKQIDGTNFTKGNQAEQTEIVDLTDNRAAVTDRQLYQVAKTFLVYLQNRQNGASS